MLRPETRLRLEGIAIKIERREEVTLDEMIWAEKWSNSNRSAYSILRRARRRAIHGEAHPDSIDGLMSDLDISDPDPMDHLIGPQTPDTLANYFSTKPYERWLQRD
jgi:hypothetical protein